MSHDIFKPSNLIGCLENKTADSAQTRKRAIVTRPFPSPGGRGLGTRLGLPQPIAETLCCNAERMRASRDWTTSLRRASTDARIQNRQEKWVEAGVPEWEVINEEGMVTERKKEGKSGHSMSGPFGEKCNRVGVERR